MRTNRTLVIITALIVATGTATACGGASTSTGATTTTDSATTAADATTTATTAADTATTDATTATTTDWANIKPGRTENFHITASDGYQADVTIDWWTPLQLVTNDDDQLPDSCGRQIRTPNTVRYWINTNVTATFPTINGFKWPHDRNISLDTVQQNPLYPVYSCYDSEPSRDIPLSPDHPFADISFVIQGEKSPTNPEGKAIISDGGIHVPNPTYDASPEGHTPAEDTLFIAIKTAQCAIVPGAPDATPQGVYGTSGTCVSQLMP